MPEWLSKTAARIIAAALVITLIAGIFAVRSCQSARTAQTREKLATGQAGAAIESGADSVNTIGNRMDADAATDTLTRTNDDAIRNAQGADAPVDPALRDAGLASLCRRAAYRGQPKCLQYTDPR